MRREVTAWEDKDGAMQLTSTLKLAVTGTSRARFRKGQRIESCSYIHQGSLYQAAGYADDHMRSLLRSSDWQKR